MFLAFLKKRKLIGNMAAIIIKGAFLGEIAALSQDAKAAENSGNYLFVGKGAALFLEGCATKRNLSQLWSHFAF